MTNSTLAEYVAVDIRIKLLELAADGQDMSKGESQSLVGLLKDLSLGNYDTFIAEYFKDLEDEVLTKFKSFGN